MTNQFSTILFLPLLLLSNNVFALNRGECTFLNQKLTYTGVDLPSSNDIYKNGDILGQLILSTDYSCKTQSFTNNDVVLQAGTRGASGSFIGDNRYRSNVEGIELESLRAVGGVAGSNNEVIFHQFKTPEYGHEEIVNGTFNSPIFNVIKSGEIPYSNSVALNLATSYNLASFIYNTGGSPYISPSSVPNSQPIPVYNASCNITHPTNVEVPALIPNVRNEVSSYFNVVLNCADKSVMQNNVQLTVNPVMTTGVSLSVDKTSLLHNSGGQIILMHIFNSVGAETQMSFSTMYQFSNSSQGNSFTIPMRAKFLLGSTGYGNFSFQTQLSVRYN
ncbi:hypothetical protein VIOR3934_20876 [Vibrio orientalis CIP 102891 = ATCC 33934]|uniref:Fimbrial protein n=1 Tax=Vibrio orientalis CIP 102891 = ATCC 33934 TaxID=675816 RepID=C9QEW0_VIBOR|nr:hypothetical protein VIA_001829 [Vibrio orientalis CIP 102891 = ATCC 33934]EGU51366.1 hypothetical protein VIOR3934_20876 [Vibrio orientalis CIP 102891 = ATCC 33934]